jgi:hypothetical protein
LQVAVVVEPQVAVVVVQVVIVLPLRPLAEVLLEKVQLLYL